MAKSILEELESLVGKDAAAKIAAKSDLATRLQEGERLYQFYTEGTVEEPPKTEPVKTEPVVTTQPAPTTTATTTTATDNKSILAELGTLLDSRFKTFAEKVVTLDKLPQYEGQ